MMKPWLKGLLCLSLSLMCIFTCVGYASLTKNMTITGNVHAEAGEPEGIYISKVTVYATSGLSAQEVGIVLPSSLRSSFTVTEANASITYEITVHNKTDMTYWYLGQRVAEEADPDGLINTTGGIVISTYDGLAASSASFDENDWVPPQTERTFYATYVFGSRAQGNVSTLVNFSFGFHMASVSDGFLKALNDKVSPYGYYYLAEAFDRSYAENNGSTVIGNVGEDQEIFNNLFGSSLTVNIDGENKPVTIMVERKDVDGKSATGDAFDTAGGPSGCEYTVYITVDDLGQDGGTATVYAVSYTCGANGVWYMIGELYEGTCPVEQYENSDKAEDRGFDVDEWHATQNEYTVVGKLSYLVASDGEVYDMWTEIEQLMGLFDQSLMNDINNSADLKKLLTDAARTVYTFRKNNNGQTDRSPNTDNLANPGYVELKRAFDRMLPYCILDNFDNQGSQARVSDKVRELSRAELIRLLEDLQVSYEYYLAVNS